LQFYSGLSAEISHFNLTNCVAGDSAAQFFLSVMRSRIYLLFISFLLAFTLKAQESSVKKINDIPHKTLRELWMWPHRSFALISTRERKITYDTAYIKSFYKRIVITLPVSSRFLKFTLSDQKSGNKLIYVPNLQYNLGISLSSRWASFVLNSGVKLFTGNAAVKGKTVYRDYQLHLYGRKMNSDIFFQQYQGFYIRNSATYNNFSAEQAYAIRSDVRAMNLGANTVYVVNHRKFSYGNAFAFVEQQKKKAGSLLIGVYYTYFAASGDHSLVDQPFRGSFDSLSMIKKGYSHNFGLNIGYIYTFVFFKKWYATASVTQGIGGERSVYTRDDDSKYYQFSAGAGKLNASFTFRYDNGRYFAGTMGMFDSFLFRGRANSTFDYTYGKLMVYAGYRFSVLKAEKRILKKLKLTDY
jgi:hypothetical protein